jgi:DnaJ-class molecular chaperone
MTDQQTRDCDACFGTGNEPRMTSPQPTRKILFRPCPACGGTRKVRVLVGEPLADDAR